jgi:hypothetical protein
VLLPHLLLQVDAYAALPYFMNPLLAACQLMGCGEFYASRRRCVAATFSMLQVT